MDYQVLSRIRERYVGAGDSRAAPRVGDTTGVPCCRLCNWPLRSVQCCALRSSGAKRAGQSIWRSTPAHGTGEREAMSTTTASITETARAFFEACETGKGWEGCNAYCHPDATFQAQSEPLADMRTLEDYAEWMKAILKIMPDGRYEVKSFATDRERNNVCAYGVFSGTHTESGGPVDPTGKHMSTDYVYAMQFEDGKIRHMTKVWNSNWAMKELGWIQ
jgi:predicted ester cyclase